MKREGLIKNINIAFDGVEQPTSITLLVAEAHDEYDYENDQKWREKDYNGSWQGIPDKLIQHCQSALSYVDKHGMRFYLPAYMTWYVKNFDTTDEVDTDNTLYSLDNHPKNKELSEYHKERFSLFNTEQMKV